MNSDIKELKRKLPKECCSFCTHLSLEGLNENYKYDIKCVIYNCIPKDQENCIYFEPEHTILNNHDLDNTYIDFLETCLRVRYDDYLKSIHWQLFKAYALKDRENKCSICGSQENLEVYHINRNLGRENLDDVEVICDKCISR